MIYFQHHDFKNCYPFITLIFLIFYPTFFFFKYYDTQKEKPAPAKVFDGKSSKVDALDD